MRLGLAVATGVYVVGLLGLWAAIRSASADSWVVHLFLFGPRVWVALPWVILLVLAGIAHRRLLVPLGLIVPVALVPVAGLNIPWGRIWPWSEPVVGLRLRVLTNNTQVGALDVPRLERLVRDVQPDVVLLQEWTPRPVPDVFQEPGWTVLDDGEIFTASRYPIRKIERLDERRPEVSGRAVRYELNFDGMPVQLVNLHLRSARDGLYAVLTGWKGGTDGFFRSLDRFRQVTAKQQRDSRGASEWIAGIEGPLIIAGDFNVVAESAVYRDYWSRYLNAFERAGFGVGRTKLTRLHGVRIDHILCGPEWETIRCWVGPNVGSDHLPVIADLAWTGPRPTVHAAVDFVPDSGLSLSTTIELPGDRLPASTVLGPPPAPTAPPPAPTTDPIAGEAEPEAVVPLEDLARAARKKAAAKRPAERPTSRPAAPPGAGAGDPRLGFLLELGAIVRRGGPAFASEVQALCQRNGAGPDAGSERLFHQVYDRRMRQARIRQARARGVSEAVILVNLAQSEATLIGRRDGPRNAEEALLRAARLLVATPPD